MQNDLREIKEILKKQAGMPKEKTDLLLERTKSKKKTLLTIIKETATLRPVPPEKKINKNFIQTFLIILLIGFLGLTILLFKSGAYLPAFGALVLIFIVVFLVARSTLL